MSARKGEMGAAEAARYLEIHERTVRRWVRKWIFGEKSPLAYGRIDTAGRYWVRERDMILLHHKQKPR